MALREMIQFRELLKMIFSMVPKAMIYFTLIVVTIL